MRRPCEPVLGWMAWALLAVLGSTGLTASAQNGEPPAIGMARIRETGLLRVAMTAERVPGFYNENDKGELVGHEIDLAGRMAKELGVELRVDADCESYDAVVQRVAAGQADIGLSLLSRTQSRAGLVLFSRPYVLVYPALAVNRLAVAALRRGAGTATTVELLSQPGIEIAAPEGSAYLEYARADFPDARIVEYENVEKAWQGVAQNRVAAFYYDEIAIKAELLGNPAWRLHMEPVILENLEDPIAIAMHPRAYLLKEWVDLYLDATIPQPKTADEIILEYKESVVSRELLKAESRAVSSRAALMARRWQVTGAVALAFALLAVIAILRGRREDPTAKRPVFARVVSALQSPLTILGGVTAGILIGLYFHDVAARLRPLSSIYLALLQMCVLPIIVTAVVVSLGQLLCLGGIHRVVVRLIAVTLVFLAVASFLGAATGVIMRPGAGFDESQQALLGEQLERFTTPEAAADPGNALPKLLVGIVPPNIFEALSRGNNLGVLLVSLLLGTALGVASHPGKRRVVFDVLECLNDAFTKLINWFMVALPFGLCALLASQMSTLGFDSLRATGMFVVLIYALIVIWCVGCGLVLWRSTPGEASLLDTLRAMRRPLLIGIGTGRPIAAIPSTIEALAVDLRMHRRTTGLVAPLLFNTVSFGNILHFALSTLFLANLYDMRLGPTHILLIMVLSVLASCAAIGAPGVLALTMISLVLGPVNLPVASSIVLLMAIDPLLDQPLALATVYGNAACTALVAGDRSTDDGTDHQETRQLDAAQTTPAT